jgi:2-polyprenyl-3-methyl-5-hydroxy-6-metoxy-1,4-benzoquinol methylase
VRKFDRVMQRWRIEKVRPYVPAGARVLDIGSSDGALYESIRNLGQYVGIEPDLDSDRALGPNARLIRGMVPKDLAGQGPFDTICMLAVLEHIPPNAHPAIARGCFENLRPGGHLVVTVPSPRADGLLHLLRFLRVIDGMSLNQHYGFPPKRTGQLFERVGLKLVKKRRFQLGFNNLFVFQRP